MSKLRLGVVGLGIGRRHAEGYIKDGRCEVAALCDVDAERLAQCAKQLGVARTYTEPLRMFRDEKLDGVSIAVPNKFHAPLAIAALNAGLHVLCEKPMAMNTREALKMKAAADRNGRNLMINFSQRFTEAAFALRRQVDAGVLGDVYFGRTVWHRRRGLPRFGGWFGIKELSGGGPLIDLGVHRLDLALWLMGYPEPVAVSGSAYDRIASRLARKQKKDYSVEDMACGMVKFANGATLIVEASWTLHIRENELMTTTVFGTRAGLVHRNLDGGYKWTAEVFTEEHGHFFTKTLDRSSEPVPSAYSEFVSSVLEKREPLASADHGIKVMKILDGIYESARLGREVRYRPSGANA